MEEQRTAAGFVHRFVPADQERLPTLLLLHGTGGDEADLLDLGRMIMRGAALLSPRGKVLENGMPRFFRRVAEGIFDEEDLVARTHELAHFVKDSADIYGFDPRRVIAVGFSNGANIAASLLLIHPRLLAGAVLLHAMVPLVPNPLPGLDATPVFLAGGRVDRLIPPEQTERLARVLREVGADVTLHWEAGGHSVTPGEIAAARVWLGTRDW